VVAQPIGEAEFGYLFSHVDCLVRYMREHLSLTDAALRALPSLPRLSSREDPDAAPAHSQFVQRYSLLCLRFGWQAHRSDSFPDPARDQRELLLQEDGGIDFVRDALDLPPFGWVDALDGRYVNWFGEALGSIPRTPVPDEETCAARYISLELPFKPFILLTVKTSHLEKASALDVNISGVDPL
jgi:hypothetical protein